MLPSVNKDKEKTRPILITSGNVALKIISFFGCEVINPFIKNAPETGFEMRSEQPSHH